MAKSRTVHVISGDSPAAALADGLALSSDTPVVTLFDDLTCGPLHDLRDLESWRAERLPFWTELDDSDREERRVSADADDGGEPSDLLSDPLPLANADEIVLWIGTGLADQLTLAWMPQLLRVLRVGIEKLRVVQLRANSSGTEVTSLYMLSAPEFAPAPGELVLGEAERAYLGTWDAPIGRGADGAGAVTQGGVLAFSG